MATATVEQLPGGRVRVNDSVIALKSSDGMLVCGNHPGQQFCDHIEACISIHADAGLLVSDAVERTGIQIKIPLAPRQDQWAQVKFGDFHEGTQAYKLYLILPPSARAVDDVNFLGFVQRGEGRAVIRSMIYDWFRANVESDKLTCSATSHKFTQEQIWNKNIKLGGAIQLAEYWSVFTNKMCLSCSLRVTQIDDLIPDAAAKPRWSSGIELNQNFLGEILNTPAWRGHP